MHSFAVAKTKGGGAAFSRESNMELLRAANERLDKVVIENISYERVFKNYDSKETFFFIDPPYLNAKINAYNGWSEKQLREFRGHLGKLQGQWIVTLDDSEFNRELFRDCKMESVVTANKCVNHRTHGNQTFGELIISPK